MSDDLRPEFTARLAEYLLTGACVNLISPHGQGRRRTLQDLRQGMPVDVKIFHMNMRTYKSDYKGFYNAFHAQISGLPTHGYHFNKLLDLIEKIGRRSLLILHNFDEIECSNTAVNAYHHHFFQALNSINQRSNIALLCVSEKAYSKLSVGKIHMKSIDAESFHLPTLTLEQLLAELLRRKLPHTKQKTQALAKYLFNQPAPYSALDDL